MNDDKCYSVYPDEGWGDFYDVIDGLEVGDHYYEGTRVPPDVTHLIDADDIIDMLRDRAYDNYGEYAEDFADIKKGSPEYQELDSLLKAWVSKHCPVNFWMVENVVSRVLTQEDLE